MPQRVAVVLDRGVQFSKSLERGGVHFYSQCLGVHFSPTRVFQSGVTDVSFCSTSNITQKWLESLMLTCNVSSWSPVVAPFSVLAGNCHIRAILQSKMAFTATATATTVIFQFQSTTASREQNIYLECR